MSSIANIYFIAFYSPPARKDQDAMTLSKYTRMDESKIKELSLRIEHLTDESAAKRKKLQNETTETLTAQVTCFICFTPVLKIPTGPPQVLCP